VAQSAVGCYAPIFRSVPAVPVFWDLRERGVPALRLLRCPRMGDYHGSLHRQRPSTLPHHQTRSHDNDQPNNPTITSSTGQVLNGQNLFSVHRPAGASSLTRRRTDGATFTFDQRLTRRVFCAGVPSTELMQDPVAIREDTAWTKKAASTSSQGLCVSRSKGHVITAPPEQRKARNCSSGVSRTPSASRWSAGPCLLLLFSHNDSKPA
jgi:hypothetical protein